MSTASGSAWSQRARSPWLWWPVAGLVTGLVAALVLHRVLADGPPTETDLLEELKEACAQTVGVATEFPEGYDIGAVSVSTPDAAVVGGHVLGNLESTHLCVGATRDGEVVKRHLESRALSRSVQSVTVSDLLLLEFDGSVLVLGQVANLHDRAQEAVLVEGAEGGSAIASALVGNDTFVVITGPDDTRDLTLTLTDSFGAMTTLPIGEEDFVELETVGDRL